MVYRHFLRESAFKRRIAARSVAHYPVGAASRGYKHRAHAGALHRLAYLPILALALALALK